MTRYGLTFKDYDDLQIEMFMIQSGGKWTDQKTGMSFGMGFYWHYERMRQLIWPHLDNHRWHKLCRNQILKNKITVLIGPASSAKTHEAAWISLCEYFCFPQETLILVSSTDMRGLRLRIWGEISDLWQQAKDRFDYLPGNLLDSRVAITTDRLEDKEVSDERRVRDMRRGIVGVPTVQGNKNVGLGKWCFPAGQMVDTTTGPKPIELIQIGDLVWSSVGPSKVLKTFNRLVPKLSRVWLTDGRKIDCTPDHPFFTSRGWIKAIDLETCDRVFSPYETMRLVRQTAKGRLSQSQILFQDVSHSRDANEVRALRNNISASKTKEGCDKAFLFDAMREPLGGCPRATVGAGGKPMPSLRRIINGASESPFLFAGMQEQDNFISLRGMRRRISVNEIRIQEKDNFLRKALQAEMGWEDHWKAFSCWDDSRSDRIQTVPKLQVELQVSHGAGDEEKRETFLCHGHSFPRTEIRCGDRRRGASHKISRQTRCETDSGFEPIRVDRVEVLQPSGDSRYNHSEGGYTVYDLQIDGHPSFSVNGVVVHNCGIKQKRVRLVGDEFQLMGPSMLSAFSNLNKNVDFKAIILGNPSDTTDPLGMAAEPIDGWGTQMETSKTTVWQTRFMGGVCVNLIGTDSPNFDAATRNKFKYLINEQKIKETLSFFPKESPEYYSQCVGSMKISMMARRVITRQMCRQFGALGMPLWMGTERTKIAGLDAAYGGDRCVFGIAEFGLDNDSKQVLCIHPQEIVPVIVGKEEPEDQISRWVKHKCEDNNILPENFFHDSTGRGSLGTALARHWSAACNPVEFGGKPTTRPVSLDFFIYDEEDQQRRLKLSCEHYLNFVSELWYAVRYAIESGQIRSLPEDVMDEGCKRQWDWVARGGAKVIQIEPKEEMKLRTRQSPDQFDALAICVEGARRRGFQIAKLAKETDETDGFGWLEEEQDEQDSILQSHMLVHK